MLFRTGITAAKKIKTEIVFARGESSIAARTLALLLEQRPLPRKVLVIGNGEVGRLTAETLIQGGFSVGMTLRQYKYSQVQLPEGVLGLDYSQRYAHLPEFDAVVSATLSPHYTIEAGPFSQLESPPRLLVDLAVPRDLDPALGAVPGVRLWDIDQLAAGKVQQEHSRQMEQIDGILSKYLEDFRHWNSYRERAMVCKNVM